MKNEKEKKVINANEEQQQEVKKLSPDQLREQEQLFADSDLISPANKQIKEAELIQTLGGDVINLDEYVEANYVTKQNTHYFKDLFYYPLADIFGVSREVMDRYVKPHFVPIFKNNFILARFPRKVVNRIQGKNKYISYCRRKYHHYQIMTKKADDQYRLYIYQAQEIMKDKSSIKDFIIEYCTKYHLSIQLDLFENLIIK